MKHHEFTLCFGIMAADEADAWEQLGDLLKSITREQLLSSMHLEKPGDLTARDAGRALRVLDNLVDAFDEEGNYEALTGRMCVEIERAFDLLRQFGMRPPAKN
jgi:hypothetical protein